MVVLFVVVACTGRNTDFNESSSQKAPSVAEKKSPKHEDSWDDACRRLGIANAKKAGYPLPPIPVLVGAYVFRQKSDVSVVRLYPDGRATYLSVTRSVDETEGLVELDPLCWGTYPVTRGGMPGFWIADAKFQNIFRAVDKGWLAGKENELYRKARIYEDK
jgi:hypothetical protein